MGAEMPAAFVLTNNYPANADQVGTDIMNVLLS
jgi:hypothetical protein